MFGFVNNMINDQIKSVKKVIKNEIERIYNEIDENDEKIAEKLSTKIKEIPNNINVPKQFKKELENATEILSNITYTVIDKTDDVAELLRDIFYQLLRL